VVASLARKGAGLAALGEGGELAVDVVVVGAGVAGLVAALDLLDAAPHLSVAVVDKGAAGTTGSTPLAQGGMAVAVGPGDSPALHAADTLRAGDGLGDPVAVRAMAADGPLRLADLVRRGAVLDRLTPGAPGAGWAPGSDPAALGGAPFALAREGGQTVARSVRTADASGAEISRALLAAARGRTSPVVAPGRITRVQGVACALAQPPADGPLPGDVTGAWVLLDDVDGAGLGPDQAGGLALVRARAVLLASGGCGGLYAATTNRDEATADGVALAGRAGAGLLDLEFVQFHPTGLKVATGGAWRLLLTEALRGAGAVLRDADGHRFMVGRHPDAELAPRHVVTRGILDQPGGAWLDATGLPARVLAEEFPTVVAGARRHGYDLATEPVPVEPTQHYLVGGVATDLHGATSVPGLWAAGEVASTGVHGANRMAGNSLLQACVFGSRAGRALAAGLGPGAPDPRDPVEPAFAAPPPDLDRVALRADLRQAISAGAGAVRTAAGLETAAKALEEAGARLGPDAPTASWPGSGAPPPGPAPARDRDGAELASLVTVGRLIVRSALLRAESRGVHWREDHPAADPAWAGVRLRAQLP